MELSRWPGERSLEQLAILDADLVVMAHATPELKASLESSSLLASLSAYQRKRYFSVDSETIAALRFPTVLNIPWTLEKLGPALRP